MENKLWQQYQANKANRQGVYFPREGAAELGVSEGALMADAPGSVYLGGNIRDIVLKLQTLGLVQCVVRNSICVHEKQGIYENVSIAGSSGIALNVGGIDLRIFPGRWRHALAVESVLENGKTSRSVQFYDEFGVSIQKVFVREEGKDAEWQAIVDAFKSEAEPVFQTGILPPAVLPEPLDAEREKAFQERWLELKDVHHFGGLLETFHLDRQSSYRHAPQGFAVEVKQSVWERALVAAEKQGIPIMIFVGNRGIVQIQSGKVHNVVRSRGYLNVLDNAEEGFSMHLKDDEIVESWIVRRPIRDGAVTCIEGFDARRKTVIQIFGLREEGNPELTEWQMLADELMRQEAV